MAVVVTGAAIDAAIAPPLVFEQLSRQYALCLEVVWAEERYSHHTLYHH